MRGGWLPLCLSLMMGTGWLQAQSNQTGGAIWRESAAGGNDVLRVEIPVFEDDLPFSVFPLSNLGVLVVMNQNALPGSGSTSGFGSAGSASTSRSEPRSDSRSEARSKSGYRTLDFYDENLQQRWHSEVEIGSEYQYVGLRQGCDSLYLALSALPHHASERPLARLAVCLSNGAWRLDYPAVELSPHTEILSLHIGERSWGFLTKEKNDFVWYYVGMNSAGDATSVAATAEETGNAASDDRAASSVGAATTLRRIPLDLGKQAEWCHFAIDTARQKVFALFRDEKLRQNSLMLRVCDYQGDGEVGRFELLSPDEGLRLTDGQLTVLPNGQLWIGGTYHLSREKQTTSTYDRGTETTGLFAALYRGSAADTGYTLSRLNFWKQAYYDFPDLQKYMSREAWYNLQRTQEKSKGRTVIPGFTTRVRIGVETGATAPTLYVLGEVYSRVESSTTEMFYDAYGRMMPYTRTYFEGFRYRDGFLARFDHEGNPLTQSVLDLDRNRLYSRLSDYSQWTSDTATGTLLYAHPVDHQLAYRVLGSLYDPVEDVATFQLPLLYETDKVQKSWGGALTPWHDRTFLVYGYQQIRNNRLGNQRRNIFYLQKMVVE